MGIVMVNDETGEIVGELHPGYKITTKAERERATYHINKRKDKGMLEEFNDDLGGFIFAVYEMSEEFNRHEEILTQADITRLILIGTYTNYSGILSHDNGRIITRINMNDVLKLSKSAFNELYSKLVKLGIIIEEGNGLRMNNKYFFKGEVRNKRVDGDGFTRVYIDSVRDLYSRTPAKSHKLLGVIFRLIPYINREWNIICHNPQEECIDYVESMSLVELAVKLKYSSRGIKQLKNDLMSITTREGHGIVAFTYTGRDKRSLTMCINPRVIFGGSEFKNVEVITKFFR